MVTGSAVGIIADLALWARSESGAGGVAYHRVSLIIANDSSVTAMAFSARIARIDTAGDDAACIPGFVLCVAENAPFHEVRRVWYCYGANTCPSPLAGCPHVQLPACSPCAP